MDSKKTSHILLTIIAVGIFFMIFLYMKENYFDTPRVQPVVWEETVPAKPSPTSTSSQINSPSIPTPSPSPAQTPNSTPSPQNISLIVGQSYLTGFSRDTQHNYPMIYCGIESRVSPSGLNTNYMAFYAGSCEGDVFNSKAESLTDFIVGIDAASKMAKLEELNQKYNVSIVSSVGNPTTMYILRSNGNIHAYTLSKLYFDSGNFTFTEPDSIVMGQNQ